MNLSRKIKFFLRILKLEAGGKPSTWLPPGMTRRAYIKMWSVIESCCLHQSWYKICHVPDHNALSSTTVTAVHGTFEPSLTPSTSYHDCCRITLEWDMKSVRPRWQCNYFQPKMTIQGNQRSPSIVHNNTRNNFLHPPTCPCDRPRNFLNVVKKSWG